MIRILLLLLLLSCSPTEVKYTPDAGAEFTWYNVPYHRGYILPNGHYTGPLYDIPSGYIYGSNIHGDIVFYKSTDHSNNCCCKCCKEKND